MGVQSLIREDPWRGAWQPTPVFLPGESRGQRCPVGCSPWGGRESDMSEATEQACPDSLEGVLTAHVTLSPHFSSHFFHSLR